LSNAGSVAALLAAVATGQAQLPRVPLRPAETVAMPPVQDAPTQNISQSPFNELIREYIHATATTPPSAIHQPQAQNIATSPIMAGDQVAAPPAVAPSIPLVVPPSVLANQPDDPNQGQLIREVIASLLRVEQANHPQ